MDSTHPRPRRHLAAAALLVLAVPTPLPLAAQAEALARAVKGHLTRAGLDAHARAITAHERPSGSAGENAAIDHVVETLRAAGVLVQIHPFRAYTSDPIRASVSVPGTDFAPDAITMSFSAATSGVTAPAVDVGTLADLPGLVPGTGERLEVDGLGDWSHVRGKVAIVTGQPRNVPTEALEQMGAVAAIFVNPEERLNDLIVTSTWGTPSLRNAHRLPSIPVAQIRRGDGERLRAMMAAGEVPVRVVTELSTGWTTLRLAVARVGPAAGVEAPYVLFGGHIDAWYHGGTDEGASNAAMLELALAFHRERDRMRRGLVVAWWPGHSNARYGGSTWFADTFFEELRARGVAYVNVDGIGQMGARRFSASTSPALAWLAAGVVEDGVGVTPRLGRPGRNSDQAFNGVGLPLLQINHTRLAEDGGYWWWHTPEDTYDKIDVDVLKQDADLYAEALARLVAEPIVPLDLAAEAAALREALEARAAEAEGALDLAEALRRADALALALQEVEGQVRRAAPSAALDGDLLRILRPIHRIMFVPGSNHHPDPGIHGSPLPGLEPASLLAEESPDSDRYGFALTTLLRERNRILEAIDEATREATRLSERLRRIS